MVSSPYTDLARPPLNGERLRRALVVPGGLWTRLDLRAETGSTNADAAEAARTGAAEGLVVVAERQTAGRGRLGRTWSSPPRAGLTTSLLLRPGRPDTARGWSPASPGRYGWLPLLAGVALAEAVTRLTELDTELKWPNDLLVHGRKCAGILAEAVPTGGSGEPPAVVVGIGLNVTLRLDELPALVPGPDGTPGLPATSLALAGAAATDRDPLLRALLRSMAAWYIRWRDAGGDAEASGLREAYTQRCASLGRPVRALLPDGTELAGTATAVDGDGRLMLRTATGAEQAVAAADIQHLR
jgi:BirA family biotin operon repressor/biotin-[acetyl-CoA-carboxylase] ligase